jgi:hypothetical protein
MKRPQTREAAELYATMLVDNVKAPPERRTGGIGLPEITFVAGFVMAAAGLAMIWLPLGVIFAGVGLAFAAWKTA